VAGGIDPVVSFVYPIRDSSRAHTGAQSVVTNVQLNNRSMSYGTLVEALVTITVHHDDGPQATEA
jgi:hypothetical protein